MPIFNFTVTEYEPGKPWLIVSTGRQSVELAGDADFHAWARAQWASERFRIELDRPPLTAWPYRGR